MPIEGGRLNAHKARQEDFRRRKDGRIKGDTIIRSRDNNKIDFEKVDPAKLKKIKSEIRSKAKKNRKIEVILIIISVLIALIIFYWITI
tara:strand:+ start:7189 stop:7455 length:267 start_codon:yes stop_codon:yes gene_type:complete